MMIYAASVAVFLAAGASAANIGYEGLVLKISNPDDGSRHYGSFLPDFEITFHEGALADAVRANAAGVTICSALDRNLVESRPLVPASVEKGSEDVTWPIAEVTPPPHTGLGGHSGLHAFELWLSADPSCLPEYSLIPTNASVVFSSADAGALHMPDDTTVFFAECWNERLTDAAEAAAAAAQAEATLRRGGEEGGGGSVDYRDYRVNEVLSASNAGRPLPRVKGILHIGANVANEAPGYSKCVGGNGANVVSGG